MSGRKILSVISQTNYRHFIRSGERKLYYTKSSAEGGKKKVKIPFSQPLPGAATSAKDTPANKNKSQTRITVLENGMRVASEDNYGSFFTIGVLIDSGSRYEVNHKKGISHFLEKFAFGATDKFNSRDEILQSLEEVGGICDSQGSRDTLIYAMSATAAGEEKTVEILAETVLRPKFSDQEMEDVKNAIKFEVSEMHNTPEPEQLLLELYHKAAYSNNTLGLPRYVPAEQVDAMTASDLLTYCRTYHRPERMVLAGAGVDHDTLVDLARRHFVDKTPVWNERDDVTDIALDESVAQYTGGIIKERKDMTIFAHGPSPMPNLLHAVVGLEGFSHKDEANFIPMCVLHSLMGGGGSFSAGGPGKGMYTRLYTNVLNRHHWLYNATAQNHAFNDSGTFCIHAASDPSYGRRMLEVIVRELLNLRAGVNDVEFRRAKAQLKSQLLMHMESRPVMFEDLGRQVLANNERQNAQYYIRKIDAVTADDVMRVVMHMLQSPPTVVLLGDVTNSMEKNEIHALFHSPDTAAASKSKLFSFFK